MSPYETSIEKCSDCHNKTNHPTARHKNFYNAIIGVVIMLSAYSIVAFVLRALSAASR